MTVVHDPNITVEAIAVTRLEGGVVEVKIESNTAEALRDHIMATLSGGLLTRLVVQIAQKKSDGPGYIIHQIVFEDPSNNKETLQ